MANRLRLALLTLVSLVLVGAVAGADTIRLFRERSAWFSPKVVFNSNVDEFLVLGMEPAFESYDLKTRRTGLLADGRPWMRSRRNLGEWGYAVAITLNPHIGEYLVVGSGYARVDKRGLLLNRGLFGGFNYAASALAVTQMGDTGGWMTWLMECKYGCEKYARMIDPDGKLGNLVFPKLPIKDRYEGVGNWQLGYDSAHKNLLMLWEDFFEISPDSYRSRVIRGQRFGADGRLVGERLKIARHSKEASEPHMVYNPRRREWLIVYRRGNKVRARFLRGSELTKEFRVSARSGSTPSIAFSAERNIYLVTWVQSGDGTGIHGQWARADGRLIGSPFVVNDDPGDQWVFEPGYSACNDDGACLVTWFGLEDGIARGRYLQAP